MDANNHTINAAEQLWNTANIVTGFAIAHVLATIFAIIKRDIKMLRGLPAHWAAFAFTIVFTLFYIAAIVLCGIEGERIDQHNQSLWRHVTEGRVGAVLLFTAVLVLTIYGSRDYEKHDLAISKVH